MVWAEKSADKIFSRWSELIFLYKQSEPVLHSLKTNIKLTFFDVLC